MITYLTRSIIGIAACLAFYTPAVAQGGQHHGGNGNRSLTGCITFDDAVGDRITSDGIPEYCDGGLDGVGVGIAFRGGSRFDTNGNGRQVTFDFSACSDGCGLVPAMPWAYDVDWRIGLEHTEDPSDPNMFFASDHPLNLTEMDVGDVAWAGLRIDFVPPDFRPNQLRYRVQFGAGASLSCQPGLVFNPVRVERLAAAPDEYEWRISPTGPDAAGCLFRITDNSKTIDGPAQFLLPFGVTLVGTPSK